MSAKNTPKPAKKAGTTVSKNPVTSEKVPSPVNAKSAIKKSTQPVKKTEKEIKNPVVSKDTSSILTSEKTS
jgi:hypothetical protein